MSEAEIQHAILVRYGSDPRLRIWRSNSGKLPDPKTGRWVQFGFKGLADISGFLKNGRALYIEVKSPTGRQSKEQLQFQSICVHWGALYILARSVEDVEQKLAQAGL